MSYYGAENAPKRSQTFVFIASQGQSLFTGPDAYLNIPLKVSPVPGATNLYIMGQRISQYNFSLVGTTGIQLTGGKSCSDGDVVLIDVLTPYSVPDSYGIVAADTQFSRRKNRFFDPGMRISQQNVSNALAFSGTTLTTNYPSDSIYASSILTAGSMSVQRIPLLTPGGSPFRIRTTVTGANSSPGANDQFILYTKVEGLDIADLRFGATVPRTITFRLGCRVSIAGTYSVFIANGPQNRTWLGTVTFTAGEVGLDVVKFVQLVADNTGTWANDNSAGLLAGITLCAGSNNIGVAGWQSALDYMIAGSVNLASSVGATFDLFDIGLYDTTGLSANVVPPFELDGIERDILKCYRYYEKSYDSSTLPGTANASNNQNTSIQNNVTDLQDAGRTIFRVEKPIVPTVTIYSPVSGAAGKTYAGTADYNGVPTWVGQKSFSLRNTSNNWPNGSYFIYWHWTANARL